MASSNGSGASAKLAAGVQPVTGTEAVARMMRPKSVAIIGISSRPGSPGQGALANLVNNDFQGEIHLVGRSGGEINGRPCLTSVDELPEGIDLAIFTLPAAGVLEAVEGCVRRKVRSANIFTAGFAELSQEGRAIQHKMSRIAAEGGMALLGPNNLGYTNLVDGLSVGFFAGPKINKLTAEQGPGVAIMAQSGGIAAHIRIALAVRKLPSSYFITTGNEAGLGLSDFVHYLAGDKSTRAIVVFAEQVRRPDDFLAAAAKARAAGKFIVMLHPGRSEKAQAAASSHTGALASDHAVMRAQVERAGIVFVDTLEEVVDVTEILTHYPEPPTKGVGIVTFSGAYCGMAHDFCEDHGLDVPTLSQSAFDVLRPQLPDFIEPHNPLDLTTQAAWEPELVGIGTEALINDPATGSVVLAITTGAQPQALKYVEGMLPGLENNRGKKPVIFAAMADGTPLLPEFVDGLISAGVPVSRSPERTLRALAILTKYGNRLAATKKVEPPKPFSGLPSLGKGTQAEWTGKKLLAAMGIKTPAGDLARTVEEAEKIASQIGFPVVLKAQSAKLAHKTEAGGVLVGIADAAALRKAWDQLHANVSKAQPGLTLDGVLIEDMAPKGHELVVGAKRDPHWGPIVMIGLGGIWVEALGDVRLLPADLPEAEIVKELLRLRTATLLTGFRGAPALDIEAAAHVAGQVGRLMLTHPEISEVDINPLVLYPKGEGATALDALVVTSAG